MSSKGGGGSAKQAVYSATDGWQSHDPNQVAERNRRLQLASALGYNGKTNYMTSPDLWQGDASYHNFDAWQKSAAPDILTKFNEYNDLGMTAADYRAEMRLKEQEAQAKVAEQQRKDSILQSRGAIDQQLAGFDDNYYGGISKSVLDYYLPQVEEQFGDANNELTFSLARKGLLKSDVAGKERAKLKGKFDIERGNITSRAEDAARAARENTGAAKSSLYAYADAAADPAAVNDRLGAETSRLKAYAPELTPMGQLFTDYLSPVIQTVGNGVIAESQGYKGFGTGLFGGNKNSSSQVVR